MCASPINSAVICIAGGVLAECCKTQQVLGSHCIGGVAGATEKTLGGSMAKEEERSAASLSEH